MRGPERVIRDLRSTDLHAELELGDAKPGERTFDLTAQQIRHQRELHVVQVVPGQVHLSFDMRLTRSDVEIHPRVTRRPGGTDRQGAGGSGPDHDYGAATSCGDGGRRDDRSGGCFGDEDTGDIHNQCVCCRSAGAGGAAGAGASYGDHGKEYARGERALSAGLEDLLHPLRGSHLSSIILCRAFSDSASALFREPAQSMSAQIRQLFGTDGIRGVAGEFPLTAESTYLIGRALGHDLLRTTPGAKAVMGQDTRESSGWIADRVAAGLASVGVEVHSAGVITTPGVAYLARSRGFAAGVVISASHNPWTDNGIKVFSGDGFKLTDARELAIEKEIFALLGNPGAADDTALKVAGPSLPGEAELRKAYIESLAGSVSSDLSGMRVLVDCANGAATAEAPELFRGLRIQATFIHVTPDGRNINEGCGALHPETLGKIVAAVGRAV